jgi:hypothetical protein
LARGAQRHRRILFGCEDAAEDHRHDRAEEQEHAVPDRNADLVLIRFDTRADQDLRERDGDTEQRDRDASLADRLARLRIRERGQREQ